MNWSLFGHLKAEDFVNTMDGAALPPRQQAHLQSCAKCAETLSSVHAVRSQMAQSMDDEGLAIEPNWEDFRSQVRSGLLSRSVRRERSQQNWFGRLTWKPALAWGLSLAFVVVLTTGVFRRSEPAREADTPVVAEDSASNLDTVEAAASMVQSDVFDEVLRLNDDEAESLRRLLLEDLSSHGVRPQ